MLRFSKSEDSPNHLNCNSEKNNLIRILNYSSAFRSKNHYKVHYLHNLHHQNHNQSYCINFDKSHRLSQFINTAERRIIRNPVNHICIMHCYILYYKFHHLFININSFLNKRCHFICNRKHRNTNFLLNTLDHNVHLLFYYIRILLHISYYHNLLHQKDNHYLNNLYYMSYQQFKIQNNTEHTHKLNTNQNLTNILSYSNLNHSVCLKLNLKDRYQSTINQNNLQNLSCMLR